MYRILLAGLFLLFSMLLAAQEVKTFAQTKRYSGKGVLDNLNINITLDLIVRYEYGADKCCSKVYRQIVGNYSYDTLGGGIPLIGEYIDWTYDGIGMDTLILFELNQKYEKTASFVGTLTDESFKGQRVSLEHGKQHPFSIIWENSTIGSLKVDWKWKEYVLFDLNIDSNQGNYELIYKVEKNDELILLIQVTIPCCGAYNCRGANCGGAREYLCLYRIDESCMKIQKELLNSDCYPNAVLLHQAKTSDTYVLTVTDEEGMWLIKVDYNHLEKGIEKSKLIK